MLSALPPLHFCFLQMALFLALSPVPLLSVTARVELLSEGQARLPDFLAVMLFGELNLTLSLVERMGYSSKCCSTEFSKRRIPTWLMNSYTNNTPQSSPVTSLINCSGERSSLVPNTYKNMCEILNLCKMQIVNT